MTPHHCEPAARARWARRFRTLVELLARSQWPRHDIRYWSLRFQVGCSDRLPVAPDVATKTGSAPGLMEK